MKNFFRILICCSLLFFSHSAFGKSSKKKPVKTKAHQCAVFKKNAKKARELYNINKKKAKNLFKQVVVLQKDEKELPKSAKAAKVVVHKKITKLAVDKNKRIVNSLRYLEKHIQYAKAAKRICPININRKFKQKLRKPMNISRNPYPTIASN